MRIPKLRDASRRADEVTEFEAPRPKPVRVPMSAPTPMGGGGCPLRLLEMAGVAGVAVALVLSLAGCKPVEGTPSPRAPYSEDANAPDYACGYDGNHRCPADGSVNR
ncbi:hypothetical protein [Amycolatopsis sp. NPDC001319]|uniref:hypothetical protein n=1 Tax=unclassified Amycolatopsis TaxID=2618356 RepID=UPI00369FC97A